MARPRASAIAIASAIVAFEARPGAEDLPRVVATKLYASLGRLIGGSGFDVLLARALTLAARAEPALSTVTVRSAGILEGFPPEPGRVALGLVAVLSQLFELLVRFIGEDLATRVVRDVWPNVADTGGFQETTK
jgi:hypothetical protein